MFIGGDFESGLHRIQNRVIGIHSGICSSDDYMKCMRRAAVAYSQIDARYIHWNYRAGITIKYDDSGITLDRVLDLNQSLIVQIMGSVPKGRRRKIYGRRMTRPHRPKDQSALKPPIKQGYCPRLLPATTRTATTIQTAAISGHPLHSTVNQRVPNCVAIRRRLVLLQ